MSDSWLFWKSLYVIELISTYRYLLAFIYVISLSTLLFNKFHHLSNLYLTLNVFRWLLLTIG